MPSLASTTRDAQATRTERLAAELRANLKKRKSQARTRAGGIDQAAREAGVAVEDVPDHSR